MKPRYLFTPCQVLDFILHAMFHFSFNILIHDTPPPPHPPSVYVFKEIDTFFTPFMKEKRNRCLTLPFAKKQYPTLAVQNPGEQ
jgi:hypothetical protein